MDAFTKQFFQLGVPFLMDGKLCTNVFVDGMLVLLPQVYVFDGKGSDPRPYRSVQGMLAAGRLRAVYCESFSSLKGLNKLYVTEEDGVNTYALRKRLKHVPGVDIAAMYSWAWPDNHIALLFNMLRFAVLLQMKEANGGHLNCKLGFLTDGSASVDLDQWWPADYPEAAPFSSWPGGNNREDYPVADHLTAVLPSSEVHAIDLRGLTIEEANVVLMMLGPWKRSSRARLDFDSPQLITAISYRHSHELSEYNNWRSGLQGGTQPQFPSAKVVWSALRAYVCFNWLYDQFSAALWAFAVSAYQFMPTNIQSSPWLAIDWMINLPCFAASRGRCTLLTDGDTDLLGQPYRPVQEWFYINGLLEKINLIALVTAQAVLSGCAVRALHRASKGNPRDLFHTEIEFYSFSNFASYAAAEALRAPFPLPGLPDVYFYLYLGPYGKFDHPETIRVPLTHVLPCARLETDVYEIEGDTVKFVREQDDPIEGESRTCALMNWYTFPGLPNLIMRLMPEGEYLRKCKAIEQEQRLRLS